MIRTNDTHKIFDEEAQAKYEQTIDDKLARHDFDEQEELMIYELGLKLELADRKAVLDRYAAPYLDEGGVTRPGWIIRRSESVVFFRRPKEMVAEATVAGEDGAVAHRGERHRLIRRLIDARQLDYTAALAAALRIVDRIDSASFVAPEDIETHGLHLQAISNELNEIAGALLIALPDTDAVAHQVSDGEGSE